MASKLSSSGNALLTVPVGLCVVLSCFAWAYPVYRFPIFASTSIILYLSAFLSLSFELTKRREGSQYPLRDRSETTIVGSTPKPSATVTSTQSDGALAGISLLVLPLIYEGEDPMAHCLLRVACFFYACKLLDLTVARALTPPKLLHNGTEVDVSVWHQRLNYVWLLVTECRYRSFDIAVVEKGREKSASKAWTYVPPFIALILVCFVPTAETLFLLILSIIYLGLEVLHTVLHPRCLYPLFWQPFAATSITAFWSIHWHQGARPFLFSLGYVPAKKLSTGLFGQEVGSAIGVLATFSLSGIWHCWAAASLVHDPWYMGFWLWAIFVGHGVACVVERVLAKRQSSGRRMQGIVTWLIIVGPASWWIREALPRAKIPVPWPLKR